MSINSGSSRGGDDSILFQPFDPVGKNYSFVAQELKKIKNVYPIWNTNPTQIKNITGYQFSVEVLQYGLKSGTMKTVQSVTGLTLEEPLTINLSKSVPPGGVSGIFKSSGPILDKCHPSHQQVF